jgi:hypothetical protein
MSYSTVKSYLSGVSYILQIHGYPNPINTFIVQKMLQGFRKNRPTKDIRSPISLNLLNNMINALQHICYSSYEQWLFSTAFSLSFFAMLRVSEVAVSSSMSCCHVIALKDVQIFEHCMQIQVRFSKTDQYGHGSLIRVQKSSENAILFTCFENYLNFRNREDGPLFCHLNQQPITVFQFSSMLHKALRFLDIDTTTFKSHSFRIGAATHFLMSGVQESEIQIRGRWRSNAYKTYLRPEMATS